MRWKLWFIFLQNTATISNNRTHLRNQTHLFFSAWPEVGSGRRLNGRSPSKINRACVFFIICCISVSSNRYPFTTHFLDATFVQTDSFSRNGTSSSQINTHAIPKLVFRMEPDTNPLIFKTLLLRRIN